jgi:iron complex outermembrane receptor protein
MLLMNTRINTIFFFFVAGLYACQVAAQAPASDTSPRSSLALEEVLVVAQKRSESIQDVPLSISVINEDFIEEWSITDLSSAVLYTPNVKVADAGFFILPRVRGFGVNQNNKAFEPPAGVAIDGIPYTRLEYFTSALFDLERMEVYRGPQGTAFGKNTTAGLIHLITRSPTDELEGFIDYQYGDFERRRLEAGVGGPLIEGFLNFRVAALLDERDGFVENSAGVSLTGAPDLGRGTEREGYRLKLEFPDLFGSMLKIGVDSTRVESTGAGLELFDVTDTFRAITLSYDPASDFTRGNFVNTINDPDFRKTELDIYNLEWRYGVGEWGLVAQGGYAVLEGSAALDVDSTPAPAIFARDGDRSPTKTLELRLESPELPGLFGLDNLFGLELGSSNFLVGAYTQNRRIEGDGLVYEFGAAYLDYFFIDTIGSAGSNLLPQTNSLLAQLFPQLPISSGALRGLVAESVTQVFNQEADAKAIFLQSKWQFFPSWALEAGIRFNDEVKTASFNQFYSSPEPNIIMPILGIEEYQHDLRRDESNISRRFALNFQPSDDLGIFLHVARGFRGGGYNAFSFRGSLDQLQYESEEATDWGVDIKSTWLDGRMRLNLSLYRIDIDDFQVLVGVANERGFGVGSNKVENAAKARSQGLEGDMTFAVTRWLTLFATLGVNDSEYLDFTNNQCFPDNRNTDGDSDPRCDSTGKPFELTPKYTGTLLGMVTLPLTRSGLALQFGGGLDYQSEQFTTTSLDDRYIQGDVTRWRATVGIGNPLQGWSFRLQGENLTDEVATLRQGQILKGSVVEGVEAPRTVYGTFRYTF